MLIDGELLEPKTTLSAEFCVIGTGMGGTAVALRLIEAGKDVLLIEAGGVNERSNGNQPVTAEHVGRKFGIPRSRSIELGGTSAWWHGVCGRLDDIDFEQRPWIDDSGWPITSADLSSFYDEASALLGTNGEFSHDPKVLETPLRERLNDFPFNRAVLTNKIVCVPEPPRCWKNTLLELARSGRLNCLINATALELVLQEDDRAIDHVIAGVKGGTAKIRAKIFVVCTGALETPRLLLNSRHRRPNGLGNEQDLVGRFLSDHPMGHFCKLRFHRRTDAPLYASVWTKNKVRVMVGMTMSPEQQNRHALPNHATWVRPSVSAARIDDQLLLSFLGVRRPADLSLRQITAILTNRDLLYRILVHRFGFHPTFRYGDMVFLTEQVPNRNSRVQLSQKTRDQHSYPVAQIDWQFKDADDAGFENYARLLFGEALQNELYEIARVDPLSTWIDTRVSSAHHLGTARMADDPSRGVVDKNLKLFGVDNAFVCDASVFPTAGNVNPSLTIVALGRRLGNYLVTHSVASR
jgi:choline dehydrogenase-like flavoprotein